MNDKANSVERVIGFDAHPDSFTAAVLCGATPAAAVVEKVFNKVPMAQLTSWAKKHTTAQDLFALEASGNSFQVVRTLAAVERRAKVLESCQLGKLKEAHANNDKLSAVRIGKAYLAGTAKEVWVPDPKTQEWRDWFHAYTKATKRTTQIQARLRSYLSDNGVRLQPGTRWTRIGEVERATAPGTGVVPSSVAGHRDPAGRTAPCRPATPALAQPHRPGSAGRTPTALASCGCAAYGKWSPSPWALLSGTSSASPTPRNSSSMSGSTPPLTTVETRSGAAASAVTATSSCARLLIEGAQAILRSGKTPLARWGKKLLAARGSVNLAVAAIARKLTVAVWYLMMGRWTPLEQMDARLVGKVTQNDRFGGPAGTPISGQAPRDLSGGNLSEAQNHPYLCPGPKQTVYPVNSHPAATLA